MVTGLISLIMMESGGAISALRNMEGMKMATVEETLSVLSESGKTLSDIIKTLSDNQKEILKRIECLEKGYVRLA